MMTGIIRPQIVSLKETRRSFALALGSFFRSSLRESSIIATVRKRPTNSPGIMPAINSLPIEIPVIEPYKTKVIEGGMIEPIAPLVAISAEAEAGL